MFEKLSKVIKISLITCSISVISAINAYAGESLYSESNSPEFYGLTKAIIKTGDIFDINDSRYRIFARDFEDGDMTDKIQVVSNNVNSATAGEYLVEYKVVDSHGNTTQKSVEISVRDDCEERYFERTMYTLPTAVGLDAAGIGRGKGHDRQMLGFFMEQYSKLNVKIVSGATKATLTYWNNDSATEFQMDINGEYKEVESQVSDGVPFISTIYELVEPVVIGITTTYSNDETITVDEVEKTVTGRVSEVPYYHFKDNEEEFFNKWENMKTYSVIESEDFTALAPYSDIGKLVNCSGNSLDSLYDVCVFWHKVIERYDEFMGLSYDPEEAVDQNVKMKYFFKANKHGAGSAYYSGSHVGVNTDSVSGMFIVNWGGLHEVGHGYQGSLGSSGMQLGEVSNNILGHYVQIDKSIYPFNNDWLGLLSKREVGANQKREDGTTFNADAFDVGQRLYVLINLFDSCGDPKAIYSSINKLWRRAKIKGENLTNQEAYILALSELYGVNATGYFEAWGLPVSDSVQAKVAGSMPLGFLCEVVNDKEDEYELSNRISSELNRDGKYTLVTAKDIEAYDLKGDLDINFKIDDINKLIGKTVIIRNGDFYNNKFVINSDNIRVELPAGQYEVMLPVPYDNAYDYKVYNYVNVKNNKVNEVTFSYEKATAVDIKNSDTIIKLNGLGDSTFSYISFTDDEIIVNTNKATPHSYYGEAQYATISICDKDGVEKFNRVYIGNVNNTAEIQKVGYSIGDKIIINHSEGATRLFAYSNLLQGKDDALTAKSKIVTYVVGNYGIYIEADGSESDTSYDAFKARIDSFVSKLKSELTAYDLKNKTVEVQKKRKLNTAISALKEDDRDAYYEKYLYIVNGSSPVIKTDVIEVEDLKKLDLYSEVKAIDVEDGNMILTKENTVFDTDNSILKQDEDNKVTCSITDLDGNTTTKELTIRAAACKYCLNGKVDLNNYEDIIILNKVISNCITEGYEGDIYCSHCNYKIKTGNKSSLGNHNVVIDDAVLPTCEIEGKTEGSHCSICGKILVEQNILPKLHNYSEKWLSDDNNHWHDCDDCDTKKDLSKHEIVIDKAIEANCLSAGLTEGSHCGVCGKVIKAQEVINTQGHSVVIDKAISKTCTENGLTEGSHCDVCGKILVAQEIVLAEHLFDSVEYNEDSHYTKCRYCDEKKNVAEHSWNDGVITKNPTNSENGNKLYTCVVCGKTKNVPVVFAEETTKVEETTKSEETTKIEETTKVEETTKEEETTKTEETTKVEETTKEEETTKSENTTSKVPKKGKKITDSKTKAVYKVTKSSKKNGTVAYVKSTNKKAKTVKIPSTVKLQGITFKVTSVSDKAFGGNKNVTKITIGTNVSTIGKEAFKGCTKLTKITIPSKVSKIGKNAFYNCKKLKTITIKTKKLKSSNIGSNIFKGIYNIAVIKVPADKLSNYKIIIKKSGISKKVKIKKY